MTILKELGTIGQIEPNSLIHADCLDAMKFIADKSIDLILVDPPFGSTPCHWDKLLSFTDLWEQYKRIIKIDGVICIFGQEPFSSLVRTSSLDWYRYDWYWEKERLTNVFQVKRRPGKTVECISVFFEKNGKYFPILKAHDGKLVSNRVGPDGKWSVTQAGNNPKTKPYNYIDDRTRRPTQVLRINRENNMETVHPTQKPVLLLEYLIKTYTLEDELVLDNCMGSGSTIVAALNLHRNFIGIEKDDHYFEIAKTRIESHIRSLKHKLIY